MTDALASDEVNTPAPFLGAWGVRFGKALLFGAGVAMLAVRSKVTRDRAAGPRTMENETIDTTETTETGPDGEPIPTDDDGLPLVYYDDDGNPKPGIVRVTITARVERDWNGGPEDAPDYLDLQRRVAEAFLEAADAYDFNPTSDPYDGHDDDGLTLDPEHGTSWFFPNEAVEASSEASVAQNHEREGGDGE